MALPAPWLDTGITHSQTLSFTFAVRKLVPSGWILVNNGPGHFSDDLRFYTRFTPGNPPHGRTGAESLGAGIDTADNIDLVQYLNGVETVLQTSAVSATGAPGLFAPVTVSRDETGLVLGVTIDGEELHYAYFEESGSQIITTAGTATDTVTKSATRIVYSGRFLWFGLGGDDPASDVLSEYGGTPLSRVEFDNFSGPGVTGISGIAYNRVISPGTPGSAGYFGAAFRWRMDARVIDKDGSELSGAGLSHNATNRTSGTWDMASQVFNLTAGFPLPPPEPEPHADQYSLATEMREDWLLATFTSGDAVAPLADERALLWEGNTPEDPTAAFATFNTGTLSLASPVNVLLSGDAWTTSGTITATGGNPTVTINAGATGASITRTLRESWRDWNTPAHADEEDDDYTATKHDAYASGSGDDVWGWGAYAYLDVALTVPSSTTLVFTITWAVVDEEGVIRTVTRRYTKTWSSSSTQRIDLMFPDAAEGDRPFYGDRVDSIKIEGWNIGAYTITDMELVAEEDAYVQLGGTTRDPEGTVRPAGVKIAQDGQFVMCHWNADFDLPGDDTDGDDEPDRLKDHQNGLMVYAASETDPEIGDSYGGAAGMTAATLSDVFTEMHKMEGMTATYSATAMNAALTDGTNTLTPTRHASWMLPNQPGERVSPNGSLNVFARFVFSEVKLVAGRTAAQQIVYQRARLGSVLEAQCRLAADGSRAGSGVDVDAKAFFSGGGLITGPHPTDPTLATGTTDDSGYVAIPVYTGDYILGGARTIFSHYLEDGA